MAWREIRPVAAYVVSTLALMISIGLMIVQAGPYVEMISSPHSSRREVIAVWRYAGRACWSWYYSKFRSGPTIAWDLHIHDQHGDSSPFIPWRVGTGEPPNSRDSVPVGAGMINNFCAELPPWVPPGDAVTITGRLAWNGWLGWWQTWQTLQPISIPPGPDYPPKL